MDKTFSKFAPRLSRRRPELAKYEFAEGVGTYEQPQAGEAASDAVVRKVRERADWISGRC